MTSVYPLRLSSKKIPKTVCFSNHNQPLKTLNQLFNNLLKQVRSHKEQSSGNVPPNLLKLFDQILPQEYFGDGGNKKIFFKTINKILHQNAHECIFNSVLTKNYDINAISWLRCVRGDKEKTQFLQKMNIFLLDYIIKPLILFYFKPVRLCGSNQIQFIKRSRIRSFEDQIFNQLLIAGDLSFDSNLPLNCGRLHLIPKGPLEERGYRALAPPFSMIEESIVKQLIKQIHATTAEIKKYPCIFEAWKKFTASLGSSPIYFCRVDVADAFGSIKLEDIVILTHSCKSLRHVKDLILQLVKRQNVKFRSAIWLWMRGLLQGQSLSPPLCELFMASFDKSNLNPFEQRGCFIHRTVDDYFFASTNRKDIDEFLRRIAILGLNKTKTVISEDTINYCSLVFNAKTKEVEPDFKLDPKINIGTRMKVLHLNLTQSESDWETILKQAIHFSTNSIYFNQMLLNTCFNTELRVLSNFFSAMVFVAYKFDSAVQDLKDTIPNVKAVEPVLKYTINTYCGKSLQTINTFSGENFSGKITSSLLIRLEYRAFFLVFRRRNEFYKSMIDNVKKKAGLNNVLKPDGFDVKYFDRLPEQLAKVKMNRKKGNIFIV